MQRIFFIVLGILALIAIGAGVYFLFFSKDAPGISVDPGSIFGGSETQNPIVAPDVGVPTTGAGENIAPRLVKVTDGPVAFGAVAFATTTYEQVAESTTTRTLPDTEIRYVERASGNVYAYLAEARTLTRLTNTTLPGIQEVAWTEEGGRAFLRFISGDSAANEHVETYSLPINNDGAGYLLERDVSDIAVTGTSTLLTLVEGANGSVATVAKVDGSGAKTLFSSTLAAIRIFPYNGGYALFTRASALLNGYGFTADGKTGVIDTILGPLSGLTILPSHGGRLILYSYVTNGAVRLAVIDVKTRTTTALPVGTLSEKCVWAYDDSAVYCGVPRSVTGTLPDDWYQGVVSFSDRIWKVDMAARVATLIVDPKVAGATDVDAVALTTDRKGDVLVFTDKATGSLFVYDL